MTGLEAHLFSPSRVTGEGLRAIVCDSFSGSFAHILKACEPHVAVAGDAASRLVNRMRQGSRETPYLYSLHFKLIDAIQEDRLDDVASLITTIVELQPASGEVLVTDLRASEFPWDVATVAGYFNAENDSYFRFGAPDAQAVCERRVQIEAALKKLRQTVPGLADEFDNLVTTVILAKGEPLQPDAGVGFGGSSALRAFGAVLQNVSLEPSIIDSVASLVHEEAHCVLFALSPMDGVVENADDERYASPLRDDPRPMEGIFHATFVLARMVYCMTAMRQSSLLSEQENVDAATIMTGSIPLFFDGLKTVREHGVLTGQGEMAMAAAEAYMSGHA